MSLKSILLNRIAPAAVAALIALPAMAQEIKIALDSPADREKSGSYAFAVVLGEELKKAGFTVKELPVNSIGGEAERLDQTSQGLLEINLADLGRAGQINKMAFGFSLPYLFESMAHLDRATVQGKLLDKVNAGLKSKGVRVVSLMSVGGGTGIFNTKRPVTSPADLAGLRLRALDQNQMKLFAAWGANGVIITMPEVAGALQTGIADGYINPPFVPFMFGHADIIKHYTEANVSQAVRVAMVSEDWYTGLKPDARAKVDAAVARAQTANRAWVGESDSKAKAQLEKAGIKITMLSPDGRTKFQDLSKEAWTALLSPDELKQFTDAAAATR